MSSNQSIDASATMASNTAGLLSFSNEILNQVIGNLDLTPASEDAVTAICLALTARRLYGIISTILEGDRLKSLCPKPENWGFLPCDYTPEVQDRLMRHWRESTSIEWRKAVPYLILSGKLRDGSMRVMEDQGYVFHGGKAV